MTKVVWITMLAMKNERHIVEGSVPGLAHLAGVKMEECEKSLKKLLAPDPYSRNQEHGGRRIEVAEGGWLILNGEYYRKKMSADDRREYQRVKQAQYRKEKKEHEGNGQGELIKPSKISPSVECIKNQEALKRVEKRIEVLKGQAPLPMGDPRIKEWTDLKAERERLKGALEFKV